MSEYRPVDIIRVVRAKGLHQWGVSASRASEIQRGLARRVCCSGALGTPRLIAGVDMAVGRIGEDSRAAAVVVAYPSLEVVKVSVAEGRLTFPYVPGLLSFREAPLVIRACEGLNATPDLLLVDGQGIAHPRRFGLACHLGLLLDVPAIGCAKSRLCGSCDEPAAEPGSFAYLQDRGEVIGAAVRTKANTKPVYVSVGHKIDLDTAILWLLRCCKGYRLPQPTRLAHLAAGGELKADNVC